MTTDNHKASKEASGISHSHSPYGAQSPDVPFAQDINRSRLQVSFDPPGSLPQKLSSTPSTLSGFSLSRDSLDKDAHSPPLGQPKTELSDSDLDLDEDEGDMTESRPQMHRPTGGRSHQPLLDNAQPDRPSYDVPNGSARPVLRPRSSTFRSRSPDLEGKSATKKKYTYAAFFLLLSLVSFTIQTETAVYIQHTLGWHKAYCML